MRAPSSTPLFVDSYIVNHKSQMTNIKAHVAEVSQLASLQREDSRLPVFAVNEEADVPIYGHPDESYNI